MDLSARGINMFTIRRTPHTDTVSHYKLERERERWLDRETKTSYSHIVYSNILQYLLGAVLLL